MIIYGRTVYFPLLNKVSAQIQPVAMEFSIGRKDLREVQREDMCKNVID